MPNSYRVKVVVEGQTQQGGACYLAKELAAILKESWDKDRENLG